MRLEYSTWKQVEEYFKTNDLVVIPVGSTENHGSHLALGTDSIIPTKLAEMLDERTDVLFAPTVPFGVADHHVGFPGTITLGVDGLYMVLEKITSSLYESGARKFIFLNGHGGNDPVFLRLGLELNAKGAISANLNWWQISALLNPEWKGGHGGAQETSAIMAINSEWVHMEYLDEFPVPILSEDFPYVVANNVDCNGISISVPRLVKNFAPAGWFGPDHPKTATKEWGETMLLATVDYCADFIEKFAKIDLTQFQS